MQVFHHVGIIYVWMTALSLAGPRLRFECRTYFSCMCHANSAYYYSVMYYLKSQQCLLIYLLFLTGGSVFFKHL